MTEPQVYENILKGGTSLESATQHILTAHYGMMHDIKTKLRLSDSDIKDTYADAVSHVIWNIRTRKFNGQSKISTYLYRIFYNKSVDHLRHLSTNKNKGTVYIDDLELDSGANVEKDAYELIEFESVKAQILLLGKQCQGVLMDWAYYGFPMKEIAIRNGIEDANKAKKVKYACLQKLRSMLKAKKIF